MSADLHVKLQGAMIKIWECLDQEILAEGPAGTAKTRTILEMLDFVARKYASARILVIRKTRTSMTHSVMATFERFVQRSDVHFHTTDQAYKYSNGSIIAVAGMDNPAKILSSEWDVIYWNEATEGTENEWETLSTRLRGGIVPFQQMIADCNPDVDSHWLNQRAASPKMTRIVTRHEDNPRYWDADKGEYTPEGERYVKGVLDKLSGVRLLRYRRGIWASREGLVYDGFDRAIHVIRRDQIPVLQTRFCAIDFGFSNAFVCQWWGLDNDGRMYLYREIYYTQRTVKVHSAQINALSGGDGIAATVTDHDAEDRATLQENGIATIGAKKAIRPGIDAVMERLKVQGDGKPRLFIVEDALVEEDRSLRERGLPTCTLDEFGSYAWPVSKADRNDKEVPVDAYNHGMDALRYAVAYVDGFNGMSNDEFIQLFQFQQG
jgi:PBSX family phage terminase large subunit